MAAHHDTHEHHEQPAPAYRKKQALLVLGVVACIVTAFVIPGLYTSVGAILAACALIAVAAKIQPEPPEDEHHH
jgi:ABC-type transport system involved in cytochrome bd biosynthesis fused ATPase/permease subunit